jgi:hypothetical protein
VKRLAASAIVLLGLFLPPAASDAEVWRKGDSRIGSHLAHVERLAGLAARYPDEGPEAHCRATSRRRAVCKVAIGCLLDEEARCAETMYTLGVAQVRGRRLVIRVPPDLRDVHPWPY